MLRIYGGGPSKSPGLKLTQRVIDRAKKIYKGEQEAYEAAYLVQVRQTLNPELQMSLRMRKAASVEEQMSLLTDDDEAAIMKQLYEDVNDLYTDEHRIMAQADLLE